MIMGKKIKLTEDQLKNLIKHMNENNEEQPKEVDESYGPKEDIKDLLMDLYEYMENRADVDDTESDVDHPQAVRPNEEMSFLSRIESVLGDMGVNPAQSRWNSSAQDDSVSQAEYEEEDSDNMMSESVEKIKTEFRRFL